MSPHRAGDDRVNMHEEMRESSCEIGQKTLRQRTKMSFHVVGKILIMMFLKL